MSPLRVMELPTTTNAPAVGEKEMPVKAVPAAKLLLGVRRTAPSKINASVAAGAVPPIQLAPLSQLSSAPPPFQVWVAAEAAADALRTAAHAATRIRAAFALRAAIIESSEREMS